MTDTQAIALATKYTEQRKEIRKHLIAQAYRLTDHIELNGSQMRLRANNAIRKLRGFPADLSDERLLKIIDTYSKETK